MVSAYPFTKLLATNSTADAITAPVATEVAPTGVGVLDFESQELGWGGANSVQSHFQFMPFGTDANNETFVMRLYGWNKVAGSSLWIPQLWADLAITLGNIAATAIAANTFLADTIVITDGPADNGDWAGLVSDAADLGAYVTLHGRGFQRATALFNVGPTTETAASANCFVRPVDIN